MEAQLLRAEVRTSTGKGAARQLRANGMLPGVLYGLAGDTVALSVSPKELKAVLSTEQGKNVLIKLQLAKSEELTMIKELQIDPLSRRLLHLDLYRVSIQSPVLVSVPFGVRGQAKGVLTGGELNVVLHELPVRATPDRIPARIEADVSHLEMYQMLQVKELQLPEGVTVMLPPDRTLVAVAAERKQPVEEAEVAEAAAAEAAEGAAAEAAAEGAATEQQPSDEKEKRKSKSEDEKEKRKSKSEREKK